MRKSVFIFIAGAFVGTLFTASILLHNKEQAPSIPALEILDDVIREWTEPVDTSAISLARLGGEKSRFKIGTIPDSVWIYARRSDSLYHIPYGVTICQFILESKWGLADLGAMNFFGLSFNAVKKYMSKPAYVWKTDLIFMNGKLMKRVPVKFASFSSMEECFTTHARYLRGSPLYADAFKTRSPRKFIKAIARRYAQDDQYAVKLITIMRRYNLE